MTFAFMLFMMICDSTGHNCKPVNGGYYVTREACQTTRDIRRSEFTDAMCVKKRADVY